MRACVLVSVACAAALLGCGDDSGGDGGGSASMGRGTAACQDWQDALCDFAVGCGVIDRATCDRQYQGAECLSDARASECSNAFNDADCNAGPPSDCDVVDLADPAPARAKCEQLLEELCDKEVECDDQIAHDDCITALQQQLGVSCDRALTVDLGYEDCIAQVRALQCSDSPPTAVCMSVIRVSGP